jgi:hypothetical protein
MSASGTLIDSTSHLANESVPGTGPDTRLAYSIKRSRLADHLK